jgi:Spy/CpxP family protein refolding chaperone
MHGKGMHGMGQGMHGKGMPGMRPGPKLKKGALHRLQSKRAIMRAKMMQQLGLSAEQKQKMQALINEKEATMRSLQKQKQQLNKKINELDTGSANYKSDVFSLANEQATLARRMVIEKGEQRFKIESILSPEQSQKFAQMRAKKKAVKQRIMAKGKGMDRGMGMPPRGMHPRGMPPMGMPPMGMPPMGMHPRGMPQMAMPQMGKPPVNAPTMATPAPATAAPATATPPTSE